MSAENSLLDELIFVLKDVVKIPHQSNVHYRNSTKGRNEDS